MDVGDIIHRFVNRFSGAERPRNPTTHGMPSDAALDFYEICKSFAQYAAILSSDGKININHRESSSSEWENLAPGIVSDFKAWIRGVGKENADNRLVVFRAGSSGQNSFSTLVCGDFFVVAMTQNSDLARLERAATNALAWKKL